MNRTLCTAAILILCAAGAAIANPVILAPSATTLGLGQVRAEAALSPDNESGKYYWLSTGALGVEASLIRVEDANRKIENLFSAQMSFLPETFLSPALAFGVSDIGSQSAEGIGLYAVATKTLELSRFVPLVREFRATAGVGVGGIRGPFFAAEAKLPLRVFVQGEYDSRDFNAAVGFQPIEMLRFKAYNIRGDFFFGAELKPISF